MRNQRKTKPTKRVIEPVEPSESKQPVQQYLTEDPPGFILKFVESVNGYGLFVDKPIRNGEYIINYRGVHIQDKDAIENPYVYAYTFKRAHFCIDARNKFSGLARYINDVDYYTDQPNCKPIFTELKSSNKDSPASTVSFIALRDIEIGKFALKFS